MTCPNFTAGEWQCWDLNPVRTGKHPKCPWAFGLDTRAGNRKVQEAGCCCEHLTERGHRDMSE